MTLALIVAAGLLIAAPTAGAAPRPVCHPQTGMFPRICLTVISPAPASPEPNLIITFVGAAWYWKHHAMSKLTLGPRGAAGALLSYSPTNSAGSAFRATARLDSPGTYDLVVKMKMYGFLPHVETLRVVIP
jgi:hypothetical protein